MADKKSIQSLIDKMKEQYNKRFSEEENPRGSVELRSLRKKIKRAHRKMQNLKAADQENSDNKKAGESES